MLVAAKIMREEGQGELQRGSAGGSSDRIRMTRAELERSRFRKTTEGGADLAVSLPPGTVLHDGDILDGGGGRRIVVEQAPEKILTARPRSGGGAAAFLVGHVVGNRHRPVAVSSDGASVSFPIHSDSEAGVFRALFAKVGGGVDLQVSERVFRPHEGADVHGHG